MAKKKSTKKKNDPQCGNCTFGQTPGKMNFSKPTCLCKRLPPVQGSNTDTPDDHPYPVVWADNWCGEYQPK